MIPTSNQDGRQAKNRKKGDLVQVKMSSNFNCSNMARSSLTYVRGFSVKFFFQPIYTDYAN
jgi:trehalose utilization protein